MATDKSIKQLARQHRAKELCTLAHTYKPGKHDIDQWWPFPKLDGMRMIYTYNYPLTRTGKSIALPEFMLDELNEVCKNLNPMKVCSLDGELLHKNGFRDTVSTARKLVPVEEQWRDMKFHIFDWYYPNASTPASFQTRFNKLVDRIDLAEYKHIDIVMPYFPRIDKTMDPSTALRIAENAGYEGLILRNPDAPYEFGRSHNLLKVKSSQDIEVTVIGLENGTGKHANHMGALTCRMDNGKTVRVGTGFTDAERDDPPKIGDKITIEFFELTPAGIPRFPKYKTIRNYE